MADTDVITATGTAVATSAQVYSVTLAAGSVTANKVTIRDGGSGGTIKIVLSALADSWARWASTDAEGVQFETDVHVTLDAGTPDGLTIEHD